MSMPTKSEHRSKFDEKPIREENHWEDKVFHMQQQRRQNLRVSEWMRGLAWGNPITWIKIASTPDYLSKYTSAFTLKFGYIKLYLHMIDATLDWVTRIFTLMQLLRTGPDSPHSTGRTRPICESSKRVSGTRVSNCLQDMHWILKREILNSQALSNRSLPSWSIFNSNMLNREFNL